MGRNAGDRGALSDGYLGNWQGSRTYAPCDDHKPAPYARTRALTTPSTKNPSTTKKLTPLRRKTSEPNAKRPARIPRPQQALLPDDIGNYVVRNAEEVTRLGWTEFVRRRRGRGDFASMLEVKQLERCLLRQYKHCGAPVVLMAA